MWTEHVKNTNLLKLFTSIGVRVNLKLIKKLQKMHFYNYNETLEIWLLH